MEIGGGPLVVGGEISDLYHLEQYNDLRRIYSWWKNPVEASYNVINTNLLSDKLSDSRTKS